MKIYVGSLHHLITTGTTLVHLDDKASGLGNIVCVRVRSSVADGVSRIII